MPFFRATVTASYKPTEPLSGTTDTLFAMEDTVTQPKEICDAIDDWVNAGSGRTSAYDQHIDPPRFTLTVVYDQIDAPSEWDAEVDGKSLFREETAAANLPEPETVVAEAEEL